ncbi:MULTISPECIES: Spy0128 family protein [Streptococcus]|uniref:Spy0128 family protein n=1 Tax=Streptococcus TaxID=1301 RepID=UPI001604AD0C|nr:MULTISPECIES: FctA domain-containing protein [Streptococcus]MBE7885703.1 YSIRK-type signal peptide-containing protein [Streptococcus salivarius]MCB5732973.1 YSIRK-type signal peptide-containing protein [Streptococcus sp. MSK15_114]MDN5039196.1 YSIRK-type signal peptide-containing protein [Streptococcus sp. SS9]MDU6594757.1 FctA domain-containing protein [Streptococcus salivarius]
MNNRFGDSRQRFSIRKFTVGVASVLLSFAVFGVSTAKAEQAEEPKGQPATSVLEEASESDGGGQRTSTSVSSHEATVEPTVHAESISAISVTAVTSEAAVQEQMVASSEQTSTSQDKTSEGLSETPVAVNETREASALAEAKNSSTTSFDNFGLKITNSSNPVSADVKVTKIGTEIHIQNPDVEMEFPNGNNKYATNKVVYHNIPFPDDIAINSGDKVILTIPSALQFRTGYSVNVYNPNNEVVGIAQVDPKTNKIETTFNRYFEDYPIGKFMNLELDTLFSEALEGGEHLHLDFDGHVIDVTVGKVNPIPEDEIISKWGSQDKNDPTLINWGMRVNYARRVLNNLQLIDTWSDNQKFVDGSLQLRYIDSADPWIDKGSAMELIKSFSHDDTKFELNLNQLDRMVYIWYQTRLGKLTSNQNNTTNKVNLYTNAETKNYDYEVRLVGGRGNAGGEQQTYFNLELEKDLVGRDLKDKEFTFKLVDVTDSANPVDLGETTNDAKGKIVFSDLSLSKPGIYHYRVTEVPGNDEDVVYDKLEANITIQVVRETVDNQVKLVAKVAYPEDIIFNNKLVTPAKAKIAFVKELTKAGVKQDLKADQFQFVLKDRFGKVLETVGNTADGRVAFSELHFDKAGTYTYTVEEVKGTNEDIIYDGMKATVWITVTRDGDALVSTVANPKDTVFNNYVKDVQPAKAKFELTKVLTGRNLKDGEFSFVLKDDKGNVIQTVTNNAQGNISFGNIVYDKPGVYYYTVEEVKGNEADVVYDNMVAKFQVTVTKTVGEKENLLVAAVLLPLDTEFNNSYIPPKPPTPPTPPTPPSVPPKPPVVPPTPPTPPTPPVTPKPAKPVQSSEKSGPQLPETGQANDTALLALGVAAEVAAVMGVAYSHRRRKDV